ncbi:hypothetical protein HOC80_03725 [archaeon]|jgi:hypothetical protein|nr:hypothetical protein [archaeon]MBT4417187.1 hypothetical protein [archaeon]
MKRGQVTLFIILGIVIVFIIGIIYYLNQADIVNLGGTSESNEDVKLFEEYVTECHEQALESLIFVTSEQLYAFSFDLDYVNQGYPIFYDGMNTVPQELGDPFEEFIIDEVAFCAEIYDDFSYNVSLEVTEVSASVEGLISTVNLEAEILGQDFILSSNQNYESRIGFDVVKFFNISRIFVDAYVDARGGIPVSTLSELSSEHGVTFSTNMIEGALVITITDESYLIEGKPYEFVFLVNNYE